MLPQKLLVFIASPYLAATYHPCISKATHPTILSAYLALEQQAEGFPHADCPSWVKCMPLSVQPCTGLLSHREGAEAARHPGRVAGPGSAPHTTGGQAQPESIVLVAPSEGRGQMDAKAGS